MRTPYSTSTAASFFGAFCVFVGMAMVAGSNATGQEISFAREVMPVLAKRCLACHGPDRQAAGLSFDSRESVLAKLASGHQAVTPGDAGTSELLRRIESSDPSLRMPPEGKPLSEKEISALRRWIDQGAEWKRHWAFELVAKSRPPEVKQSEWPTNEIDRFILARLEAAELGPSPRASRAVLARRLYYDLIGLPPTPKELEEFLSDNREDSYERLVDKLLASPHYGERWARHWLDVVRFAESNSFERDDAKPNAWKYRDYVIRSLNEDKPYDKFVIEQLAGDELDQVTFETMAATGFYRLGIWDDEPADPKQALADEMDDIVSTTGQAFLGMTIGCARCHDHKIDPLTQQDYYSMVALMSDVTTYGIRSDQEGNNQWNLEAPAKRKKRQVLRQNVRQAATRKYHFEADAIKRLPGPLQRATETERREEVIKEHLAGVLSEEEKQEYRKLCNQLQQETKALEKMPVPVSVLGLAKTKPYPAKVHINVRGNPHALGDAVEPLYPKVLTDGVDQGPDASADKGRRLSLAKWIVSPKNPLASRVIANRVWQHHFGRGIVRSSNNLGQLGVPPTHPELLDFLARWLIDHDWRLKPLHKLIVTSSAYRMSSQANEASLAADPANDLFWRFDMRRLSAEEVRDTVLLTSGALNRKVYGPSIYPTLSREVLLTQSKPGDGWGESSKEDQARRSVYVFVKRSLLTPLLTAFDFPDPDSSCEARFNTTQPAQAFAMLHSRFLHQQAALLAARVRQRAGNNLRAQVAETIRLAIGREAEESDIVEGKRLMESLSTKHAMPADEALRYYCLAAMSFNEFLYLD